MKTHSPTPEVKGWLAAHVRSAATALYRLAVLAIAAACVMLARTFIFLHHPGAPFDGRARLMAWFNCFAAPALIAFIVLAVLIVLIRWRQERPGG